MHPRLSPIRMLPPQTRSTMKFVIVSASRRFTMWNPPSSPSRLPVDRHPEMTPTTQTDVPSFSFITQHSSTSTMTPSPPTLNAPAASILEKTFSAIASSRRQDSPPAPGRGPSAPRPPSSEVEDPPVDHRDEASDEADPVELRPVPQVDGFRHILQRAPTGRSSLATSTNSPHSHIVPPTSMIPTSSRRFQSSSSVLSRRAEERPNALLCLGRHLRGTGTFIP